MSEQSSKQPLDPRTAYIGSGVIGIGILLAVLLFASIIPSSVGENSTFLLFVSQSLACGIGFFVLLSQLKLRNALHPVRHVTMALACIVGGCFLICFAMAVGSQDNFVRLTGQEFGVTLSLVMFFLFAGGNDDILTAIRRHKHMWAALAWLANIMALICVMLWWARGHLGEGDEILTNAYLISYVGLCTTKYISLMVTRSSKLLKVVFTIVIACTVILGWVYIAVLTHPGYLPGWLLNMSLFFNASAFGAAYGLDSVIRGRTDLPWISILTSVGLMALVGVIGAVLPSNSPLVIGFLCMETLPNLPGGAISFVTELFKPKSYRPTGLLLYYSAAFGVVLCVGLVLCALAIVFQGYAVIAGGITITYFQGIPWARVAQRACQEWAKRPGKALGWLVTALILAGGICLILSLWLAKGVYSQSDLAAIWYSVARVPSAIGLGFFGLLGLARVRRRDSRAWLYLIVIAISVIGVGFAWFVAALLIEGIGATIAPGILMQIPGNVLVILVYTTMNASSFRRMADEAHS